VFGWLTGDSSSSSSANNSTYPVHEAKQRSDGKTDTFFGSREKGSSHGHGVVDQNGNLCYLRDVDGTVLYNDSKK